MTVQLIYSLLPELLLLALLLALMVLETARAQARWARPIFAGLVAAALAAVLHQLRAGHVAVIVPGELQVDGFALLAKAVLLGSGLALSLGFTSRGGYKFFMLLAAMVLGALLVMDSAGFATLFIGIEMLSLPVFALMVMGRGQSVAAEGAFKYLVMSSVGTALLLFGVSLAYGATGTLSIYGFMRTLLGPVGGVQLQVAAMLMFCGLFLKAAVFPFHAWAPDAYASARLEVMAVMASVVKLAVVLALVRIFGTAPLGTAVVALIAPLAIASIVFGNLAALGQTRFKRLLAYSSVAHAGYMIFALADRTGQRASDLLWYGAFYAGATVLAVACWAALVAGRPDDEDDDGLARLDGAFQRHPLAALGLGFALLSLAGLPPFPGFFAKLFVFSSAIASGHLLAAVLAFVGSFLGLAVYMGMVLRMFRADGAMTRQESPTAAGGTASPARPGGA